MGGHMLELPPQLYVAKLKDVEEEQTVPPLPPPGSLLPAAAHR